MQNFLEVEEHQNTKSKKVTRLALAVAFLAAKNENLQLEDLSQADFGRVSEKISSIGKEKVNN